MFASGFSASAGSSDGPPALNTRARKRGMTPSTTATPSYSPNLGPIDPSLSAFGHSSVAIAAAATFSTAGAGFASEDEDDSNYDPHTPSDHDQGGDDEGAESASASESDVDQDLLEGEHTLLLEDLNSTLLPRAGDDAAISAATGTSFMFGVDSTLHQQRHVLPNVNPADSATCTYEMLNPVTKTYEFGGPLGATVLTFGMPAIVVALNALCTAEGCPAYSWDGLVRTLRVNASFDKMFNLGAFVVYCAWIATCVGMYHVLPGQLVPGTELRDGTRLTYKLNAFSSLVFTAVVVGAAINFEGLGLLLYIADNFMPLLGASIVFTYGLSLYLYVSSRYGRKMLALGGNSGNALYDHFIGRELNPRIGTFDLKSFFELRPGLIGWLLINYSFAAKQFTEHGYITDAMFLILAFQTWYVGDALYNEQKLLSTMDITTDGFGYMLAAGDIMWVPFSYSLQTRYLALQPDPSFIGLPAMACVLLVQFTGYAIFRGANSQKDRFKANPNAPEFATNFPVLHTRRGTKLMAGGWWGMARHINYFGDWLMAVAWSLPCGFADPIPYFYPIYFAVLLVHRFYRDEHKCREKYGEDWDRYCDKVKYKIIPYVW